MAIPTVSIGGGAENFTDKPSGTFGTYGITQAPADALATPPPGSVATSVASTSNDFQVGQATATAPWQTLNLFIGEFSRVYGLGPNQSILWLKLALNQMSTQFYQ